MVDIYRVHRHLRNINPEAYEPNIIAIGPYHHGKEQTMMMEFRKKWYMQSILERYEVTFDEIFSAVKEISHQALAAYAEPVEISLPEFEKMLVIDGCFIVELVRKFDDDEDMSRNRDPIFQLEWMMKSLQRDLMLFENQIPFFVLEKICEKFPELYDDRLLFLVFHFFKSLGFSERDIESYRHGIRRTIYEGVTHHLLSLIHTIMGLTASSVFKDTHATSWRFIGSVTDLEEANVQFERYDTTSLFDITFHDGILRIPTLVIEERTESLFRNLMVFEMYYSLPGYNFFMDYALFIHCLINSSADAKLLQLRGIIENRLGTYETVASFANKITDSVSFSQPKDFRYTEMFDAINMFHDRSFNRYKAKLKRDYFNSPWSITSFVAAAVLLVITFISTVFTGMQTFKK